jgi:hypothetical protein
MVTKMLYETCGKFKYSSSIIPESRTNILGFSCKNTIVPII